MAFLLQGYNGVYSCGTVGESHSCSQLSTTKCTFSGNTSSYCGAKVLTIFILTKFVDKFWHWHRPYATKSFRYEIMVTLLLSLSGRMEYDVTFFLFF